MPVFQHPIRFMVTAAVAVQVLAGAAYAQRVRPNDAYQPPADQSGLGTLNGPDGQAAPAGQGAYGGQGSYGQGGQGGYAPAYGNPAPGAGNGSSAYGGQRPYGSGAPTYGQGDTGAAPQRGYADNRPAQAGSGYGGGSGGSGYGGPGYGGSSYGVAGANDAYRPQREDGYGQPYSPPPADVGPPPRADDRPSRGYYEQGEIVEKGKGFFGSIAQGLASAVEYTYAQAGRPNGYILGEDGGGAFFGGLRYGQGTLYTKDAGDHRVYWQGPSLGWDVGGEGSKVMILVYNLSQPGDIYHRFGGVEGSTYVVGGVAVQFQKHDDVTLALIRSGVGLRLGVNVGYLKYTREPTLNPF